MDLIFRVTFYVIPRHVLGNLAGPSFSCATMKGEMSVPTHATDTLQQRGVLVQGYAIALFDEPSVPLLAAPAPLETDSVTLSSV